MIFQVVSVQAEPTLSVRETIQVDSGDSIYLYDVVEFAEPNPKIIEAARLFKLCDSPPAGERRVFSSRALSEVLRTFQAQLEERALHARFVLPKEITVERVRKPLEIEAVRSALLGEWEKTCSKCRFMVYDLRLPQVNGEHLDGWKIDFKGQAPRGSFSIPILVQRNNKPAETIWVQGRLDILREVPVANRTIYFGERLTANDYRWEYREVTYANDTAPQESELNGQRVKSPVHFNDIIWRASLEREKALYHGEMVRVRIGDPTFEVSVDGRAQQDGYVGDTVNVLNVQSQKVISGRVVGKGEVAVQ
jgi:flagella basal body P-ring formation protein FlgA